MQLLPTIEILLTIEHISIHSFCRVFAYTRSFRIFAYNGNSMLTSGAFLLAEGTLLRLSTSPDCKQRSSTVSKRSSNCISKRASSMKKAPRQQQRPNSHRRDQRRTYTGCTTQSPPPPPKKPAPKPTWQLQWALAMLHSLRAGLPWSRAAHTVRYGVGGFRPFGPSPSVGFHKQC